MKAGRAGQSKAADSPVGEGIISGVGVPRKKSTKAHTRTCNPPYNQRSIQAISAANAFALNHHPTRCMASRSKT